MIEKCNRIEKQAIREEKEAIKQLDVCLKKMKLRDKLRLAEEGNEKADISENKETREKAREEMEKRIEKQVKKIIDDDNHQRDQRMEKLRRNSATREERVKSWHKFYD